MAVQYRGGVIPCRSVRVISFDKVFRQVLYINRVLAFTHTI